MVMNSSENNREEILRQNNLLESKISKKYSFFAGYGFIWIIMLLISFVALIVLFNSSSSEKSDILIADSAIIVEDLTKNNPIANNSVNSYLNKELQGKQPEIANKEIILKENKEIALKESDDDNLFLNNTNPKAISVPKEDKVYQNLLDTPITELVKNNKAANASVEAQLEAKENLVITKKLDNQTIVTADAAALKDNSLIPAKKSTKPSPVAQKKSTSTLTKPVMAPATEAWLVSIYSSANKASLVSTTKVLQLKSKNLLTSAHFYAIPTTVKDKATYRLTAANSANGYYEQRQQAASFCVSLKEVGLDCFVVKVSFDMLAVNKIGT